MVEVVSRKMIYKILHRLREAGKKSQLTFEEETVHLYRVAFKKIRALMRIRSICKKIEISALMTRFYHDLGHIRDLQLYRKKLQKENRVCKDYLSQIDNQIISLKTRVSKIDVDAMILKFAKTVHRHVPKNIQIKQVEDHIKKLWKRADCLIAMNLFLDTQLHAVRKILKDIYYLSSIIKSTPRFYSSCRRRLIDEEYLKLMTDLGSFQDMCTSIAAISRLSLLPISLQKEIVDKWKKEKLLMKNSIVLVLERNMVIMN